MPINDDRSIVRVIIHSFFIVPLLIAGTAVLLVIMVRLLTREDRTIYDYLNDIKTGSATVRWQSAFELSKLLSNPKLIPDEDRFVAEMTNLFQASKHDDNRVRQYLAIAIGRTGNPKFVELLLREIKEAREENLVSIIYALGLLRDTNSAKILHNYSSHSIDEIRLATAIALGNIGNPESIEILRKMLHDNEANIQWDSAIALAKMGDNSGKNLLLKMLDREYLRGFPEIDLREQNQIITVALRVSVMLNDGDLNKAIKFLSENSENIEIRKIALEVMK